MAIRGLSQKIVYVYNPLPNVTDKEILERAGLLDLMFPSQLTPFSYSWKYNQGLDQETVDFEPGTFQPLRENEAKDFLASGNFEELGLIVVESNDPSSEAVRQAAVKGLMKAAKFYNDAGSKALQGQRMKNNWTAQDLADRKGEFWPYYCNQAKEACIREKLTALQKPAAKKG